MPRQRRRTLDFSVCQNSNKRIERWLMRLMVYYFQIRYIPGNENTIAYAYQGFTKIKEKLNIHPIQKIFMIIQLIVLGEFWSLFMNQNRSLQGMRKENQVYRMSKAGIFLHRSLIQEKESGNKLKTKILSWLKHQYQKTRLR